MPFQITCASPLPGKTGKHENHIFHSNAVLVDSAAAVGLCCTHNAPVCCFPERKIVICAAFDSIYLIASTFVEIVRYPINIVH